jgi:HlyD family secretion protein
MKTKHVILIGVVILIAAAGLTWLLLRKKKSVQYRTAKVERGTLVQTVRATGVVQPVKLVQVGTQVNGPVKKLYVDYNNLVKEGDLVAQIDPTVYEAQLARDEANLKQSSASVEQAKAKLLQADKELERSKELAKREMVSQAELETATADRDSLAAQLKVAEAAIEQSKAALSLSKANLNYTTIRSPVDGVVVARNVDEGQTVVASMSAQVLFKIATDLRQIQVVASIPEADIGKIRIGQPVTFTVDAYDQEFTGQVAQVRLAAETVQNVVTYPVVVSAGNPDGKLFPSMTANISCEVARRDNVLKIPNAALRFKPDTTMTDEESKKSSAGGKKSKASGPKVWIQDGPGQAPRPVPIKTGITDGAATELIEATKADHGPIEPPPGLMAIEDGQSVITGIAEAGAATQTTVNPFTPQIGKGKRMPPPPH